MVITVLISTIAVIDDRRISSTVEESRVEADGRGDMAFRPSQLLLN